MGISKILLPILLFLLVACSVSALEIESQNYEFQIVGNTVHTSHEIMLGGSLTGAFDMPLPEDAEAISLYVDNKLVEYSNALNLASVKKIRINYLTSDLLDKGNFLASIPGNYNTNTLSVKLVLEEGASIMKEKSDGVKSPSIFPEPSDITSDGQSIILVWEKQNFEQEDGFPIYVRIKQEKTYIPEIIALIALIVFIVIIVKTKAWEKYLKKPKQKKEKQEPKKDDVEPKKESEHKTEKAHEILEHLKEDEQQIVRVLKDREGSCEQGTLRVVTSFSKAHLSRLLMELEARKVIYKEKRGKKNLVFLK